MGCFVFIYRVGHTVKHFSDKCWVPTFRLYVSGFLSSWGRVDVFWAWFLSRVPRFRECSTCFPLTKLKNLAITMVIAIERGLHPLSLLPSLWLPSYRPYLPITSHLVSLPTPCSFCFNFLYAALWPWPFLSARDQHYLWRAREEILYRLHPYGLCCSFSMLPLKHESRHGHCVHLCCVTASMKLTDVYSLEGKVWPT